MRLIICLLMSWWCAAAMALDVGDPAPPLDGVTWVKGEAVKPAGAITVVEFWATWCGPCRESIPHLTELQKKYGDKVRIIGLSDEASDKVKPFVEKMAEKMDYRVGIAPKPVHESYMEGVEGIPHAFLLDATGTVVWTGHPSTLSDPLARLIAGTFDSAKAKQIAKLEKELDALLQGQQPDVAQATTKTDAILAVDPVNSHAISIRLAIGSYLAKPEMVRETLARIPIDALSAENANELAWQRLTDENLATRNLDLALAFIAHALVLEPDNARYLDTSARAQYCEGLIDEAIATQEHAVKLDSKTGSLADALAYYRQVKELRQHPPSAHPAALAPPTVPAITP